MAISRVISARGAAAALAAIALIELGVILYLVRDELPWRAPKPEISLVDTYGMTVDQVLRQFGKPQADGSSKYAVKWVDPRYKKDDPDRWNIEIGNFRETTVHRLLIYGDLTLCFNLHHRMIRIEKLPMKSPEKQPTNQPAPPD